MAYRIHAVNKGVVRNTSDTTPRKAAETATIKAAVGYRVTVFDDAHQVMMICEPGKYHRRGKLAERRFRTARCRVVDPAFKRRLKGR